LIIFVSMSLYIASLNSGSNGNCYYVANANEAVLIDAGISCRETEKRMTRLGLSMQHVKAIFISHEHSDHINGVEVLSKKYNLPVYITHKTYNNSGLQIDPSRLIPFKQDQPVQIGEITVIPFTKFHDAADPFSFMLSGNGVNVGVLTDLGVPCNEVIKNFPKFHAVFLETNYDENMLENGSYPYALKKRIKGDQGHLSNDQALQLFLEYRSPNLSHVLLSHLSKENNSPQLVQKLFREYAGNIEIIVASRYQETDVYEINPGFMAQTTEQVFVRKNYQMKLF
jgi:phosphoribosyl 1,2-cyclic phosphodiesterase